MWSQSVFVCIFVISSTFASDMFLGDQIDRNSMKIYSERKEASPAPWKRTDTISIETQSNHQIISTIDIKDLRPEKDGEVTILEGGIEGKSVKISIKSPTVFRGYDFQIDVYAANPNARYENKGSALDLEGFSRY